MILNFMVLFLKISPYNLFFPLFVLQKESCSAIHKRQWTQLLGLSAIPKLLGSLTPAYWLLWNNAERKNTGSLCFCSLSPTSDYEPQLCDPLDSPWRGWGEDAVLEAQAYCVLSSACLGIKAIFLFSSKKHLFLQMYKVPIFLFLFALFQNSQ